MSPNPIRITEAGRRIAVDFEYDHDLVAHLKSIAGREWNPDEKRWTVPRTGEALDALLEAFDGRPVRLDSALRHLVTRFHVSTPQPVTSTAPPPAPRSRPRRPASAQAAAARSAPAPADEIDRLLDATANELTLRRYSPRTRKVYIGHVRRFLQRWTDRSGR